MRLTTINADERRSVFVLAASGDVGAEYFAAQTPSQFVFVATASWPTCDMPLCRHHAGAKHERRANVVV